MIAPLSIWLLVLITGPVTAKVTQPFYTTQSECQQHATPSWRCVEFKSQTEPR